MRSALSAIGAVIFDPNPILVKELRAMTREPRFFIIHMLMVLVVSLVVISVGADAEKNYAAGVAGYDAAKVGTELYTTIQIAMIAAVVIMVPGFSAATISSEKDRKTFELMISCSTDPLQIVWGKFLACMLTVAITVGSVLPLFAMAFFFGGVSIVHVVGFSVVLMLFAALLAANVIYISAMFESSTWATLSAYMASAFIGVIFGVFFKIIGGIPEVRELYGIVYTGQETSGKTGLGAILAGWLVPLCITVWLTAYFFTSAAAMLDRLPVYRFGQTNAVFRWVQERGLAILAGVSIVSFVLACMGA